MSAEPRVVVLVRDGCHLCEEALRIIDAAELAHALNVAQQHEARQGSGRVIDAETREVRK